VVAAAVILVVGGVAWFTSIFSGDSSYPMSVAEPIEGVSVDPTQPGTLAISVTTKGYCSGAERKPEIGNVEVRRTEGGRVVLTAYVVYFQPASTGPCNGVGLGLISRVHVRRLTASDTFYDGSNSPPTRAQVLPWHDLVPPKSRE
jgi:hypothetical protein